MIEKLIGYEDFNGVQQAEIHYFHLSKVELIEMEVQYEDGFSEYLKKVAADGNAALLFATIKNFVGKSYGVRSEDGRKFTKSPELAAEFLASQAYEALFMELASDGDAMGAFLIGVMPKDLMENPDVKRQLAELKSETVELPAEKKHPQDMSREELLAAFAEKNGEQLTAKM